MELDSHPVISHVCDSNSYLVVVDSQIKQNNGYLRSLPLLYAMSPKLDIAVRTKEAGNNCKKPVNILNEAVSYGLLGAPLTNNQLSIIAIDEEIDKECQYVHKYIERRNAPRIFLSPERGYVPEGWPLGDRTIDDETLSITQTFENYFSYYLKNSPLSGFELRETKNIVFMEFAYRAHQLSGKVIHSLFDLFDYHNPNFALSPIWDLCYDIIKLRDENIVSDWKIFIFNCLRPWIEKNGDNDKLSDIILEKIKEAKGNCDILIEQRKELLTECNLLHQDVKPLQQQFMMSNVEQCIR